MDNNISSQVKKIIEVDKKAVELESKREYELKELEQAYKNEMEKLDEQLLIAREDARKVYEKLMSDAKNEVETMEKESMVKLEETEKKIDQAIDLLASEWWDNILKNLN